MSTLAATVLGALVIAGAPAHAAAPPTPSDPAPPATPGTPGPAALTRVACHSTLDPAADSVSVTSIMRHLPGTKSLAVRFTLRQQLPGAAPTALHGGDLGRWLTPADRALGRQPADVWKLTKAVYNVAASARYQFQVAFRWTGSAQRVLSVETLESGECGVRDLRPDVLVRRVIVEPPAIVSDVDGNSTGYRYVAVIGNRGASASGPFLVQFTPGGGSANETVPVASLAPGALTRVAFTGSLCEAADPPTVVADPSDAVDDSDRSNNSFTVRCPPAVPGASVLTG